MLSPRHSERSPEFASPADAVVAPAGGGQVLPAPVAQCPALLVSAPASGQGKTTVVSALARLHTRQGRRVRVFKCGADFLDPGWHTLASGAPVHPLDLWMTGEEDCRARLFEAAQEADLILVEGVMGLFDGEPSSADLARHFGLPVLMVVDASAMAGTFGALTYGLQHYAPGLPWAGVLANQVAGERHADMLKSSLRDPADWLGAVPRSPAAAMPERHLGLTTTTEVPDALQRLDAAADALQATPLGQMTLQALQRWLVRFEAPLDVPRNAPFNALPNPPMALQADASAPPGLQGKTIAVARDAAFCFIYAANLECLQAMGATLCFFSPLVDAALPPCDAVWLPGGYPELHAAALAANTCLRDSLVRHCDQGKPVWAECGGMMALFETLVATDGARHTLWGLLPGDVCMQPRLAALGPQQLSLSTGTLRGHTFHHSTTQTSLVPLQRTARPGQLPQADQGEALWQHGSVRASYFHAWFPSCPAAVVELFGGHSRGVSP